MNFHIPAGSTPLDPNEAEGLIPDLTTQAELNELEQINIDEAWIWAQRSRKVRRSLLELDTLTLLHLQMFGKTWRWAGKYRTTQKNIGCESWKIQTSLYELLQDVNVWIKFSSYPPDEIIGRFHHRLVSIHAFSNGNGRHGRIAADLLSLNLGTPRPTWGMLSLPTIQSREAYIKALRAADANDLAALIRFLRS